MPDRNTGPFCTVPGCIEPAEGAVLFAYTKEQRRYLCTEHLHPIRVALVKLLHVELEAEPAAPAE